MATQRGAVLIAGLVFLLLLTLLATSSMQNATLQEKMAGSQAARDASFQAAESTLRLGEALIRSPGFSQARCPSPVACLPPPEAMTLTEAARGASGVVWAARPNGLLGIQYLGEIEDVVGGQALERPQKLYRVTAIGLQGTSRTVLESLHTEAQRIMWRQRL
ncbi:MULTISPECIES: PilX N-terminal domain-containing pilus assembly protein [unclassified Pseudomonas]|uniref:pilus assembly PilX family protein n=1 Tax=unclassified Pseudomonas TaxID=196821 RepID=UPI0021140FA5|nr:MULTISPECIES: PilX N-terminal domain-containing pilus assembly protein [unclassified Pseudomonas]